MTSDLRIISRLDPADSWHRSSPHQLFLPWFLGLFGLRTDDLDNFGLVSVLLLLFRSLFITLGSGLGVCFIVTLRTLLMLLFLLLRRLLDTLRRFPSTAG